MGDKSPRNNSKAKKQKANKKRLAIETRPSASPLKNGAG
jgi:hypothetical protein